MKTVSSTEAQNHFGELLDTAQREPISITRRGHPVAVIFCSKAYHSLAEKAAAHIESSEAYLEAIAAFRGQGQVEAPRDYWLIATLLHKDPDRKSAGFS